MRQPRWIHKRLRGAMCGQCGLLPAVEIIRGKPLCRLCLNPPPALEYLAADWQHFAMPKCELGRAV